MPCAGVDGGGGLREDLSPGGLRKKATGVGGVAPPQQRFRENGTIFHISKSSKLHVNRAYRTPMGPMEAGIINKRPGIGPFQADIINFARNIAVSVAFGGHFMQT